MNITDVINLNDSDMIFNNQLLMNSTTIDFNDNQLEILRTFYRVLSSVSVLGLVFVQLVFWYFKSIRTFALELVAYLCFSNVIFNISGFIPVHQSDNLQSFDNKTLSSSCITQSLLNIIFDLSSMMWTTIIGYTAYISVTNQERLENNKIRFRILFLFLAYCLPLIFGLIVLFTHTYGPSGVFCWIASHSEDSTVKLFIILYYSFTWLIIIFNCFFVLKVILLLRRELKNEKELIEKYTSKLKWYPLVQIISFIPCTINRIYNLITGQQEFYLMLIQVIFDSLTGLMFSIVYGFNASVKKTLSECLNSLCCKKQERRLSTLSDNNNMNVFNKHSNSLTYIDESMMTDS